MYAYHLFFLILTQALLRSSQSANRKILSATQSEQKSNHSRNPSAFRQLSIHNSVHKPIAPESQSASPLTNNSFLKSLSLPSKVGDTSSTTEVPIIRRRKQHIKLTDDLSSNSELTRSQKQRFVLGPHNSLRQNPSMSPSTQSELKTHSSLALFPSPLLYPSQSPNRQFSGDLVKAEDRLRPSGIDKEQTVEKGVSFKNKRRINPEPVVPDRPFPKPAVPTGSASTASSSSDDQIELDEFPDTIDFHTIIGVSASFIFVFNTFYYLFSIHLNCNVRIIFI
ncbi:unnamed protein product [Protopolystoma xenopodis]|uniref:Uncharacterized protein n=1 Tax=Protopolystoma xenopodis TaxID=117903 RepID=A0A3S5ADI7_9PLAT|nr:unnamed protein product [Protopolystoma xenopodis]